jgi:urease accessory protein
MTDAAALPLLVWLSPAFPVGGFAYSHGLEWAVEAGAVRDADTAREWIRDLVERASGRNDAVLLAAAWRAAAAGDADALGEAAELAVALQPSAERHLEATAQGAAFVTAARAAWAVASLDLLARACDGEVAYPVAVGVLAAGHAVPLDATLRAYLTAFAGNLVSAAVRLGPIGQTDGQRIMAALLPVVASVAREAEAATLDDLGGASFRSDIASLRHETQYTRLFRS